MPYIFGKLWHLAIIWPIRKAFQCILQGVRILLANHTRISPTSDNESYSSDVVIFEILVQIYMRSKCQVKPIIVIYIEIHRKDDYCLTEPMQFICEVGEVLAALCRVA